MRIAVLALILVGCTITVPGVGEAKLPTGFPSDFPTPPSSQLISATGPLPFMPEEVRGYTAQWNSSLSRAELEGFYAQMRGTWRARGSPLPFPSVGPLPISMPTGFLLVHESDGATASVLVGMTNPGRSGTLVQVTVLPPRPMPSPTSR